MTPYLILTWNADETRTEGVVQSVRNLVEFRKSSWQLVHDTPGRLIAVGGDRRVLAGTMQGFPTVIIGDIFARGSCQKDAEHLVAAETPFDLLCAKLTDEYWGSYIAVQLRSDGDAALFRDPIGMLDGVGWSVSGVHLFASSGMPWLECCPPTNLAIDWQRVAQLLLDSGTLAETTALRGVGTIPPGACLDVRQGKHSARRLWKPCYARGDPGVAPSASALRDIVLRCSRAWTERYPDNVIEISGGFDSAVVAVSSVSARYGVNFYASQLSGDERRYARDIARSADVSLDEVFMPVGALGEADIAGLPVDVRPGLASASLFHDRPLAEIAVGKGASALFTGHGGDSVFFQHPTAMIAADATFPRWDLSAHAALAKWSSESIWTVMGYAFHNPLSRESRRSANEAIMALPITMDARAADSWWTGDVADFPPAKRAQLAGIASDRGVLAPSWRSHKLTVVHPLLSQPLVELAVAADTFVLTEGRRDRALARKAFSAMLPRAVSERRGKGALAQFFGQCLCASVPFLRTFLLDGLLVRNAVLDGERLAPMLDVDYLMRFDCYAKLRSVMVMEHWARVWQDRMTRALPARSHPDMALPI